MYMLCHASSAISGLESLSLSYKPVQVGDINNIFHDFKVMFIWLNGATNNTVHASNYAACITALSKALKGGFIMTYIHI